MRTIVFTAQGSSSVFGNFGPGDRLRCSDAEARHFVVDAHCARYADEEQQSEPAEAAAAAKPAGARKPRNTTQKAGA